MPSPERDCDRSEVGAAVIAGGCAERDPFAGLTVTSKVKTNLPARTPGLSIWQRPQSRAAVIASGCAERDSFAWRSATIGVNENLVGHAAKIFLAKFSVGAEKRLIADTKSLCWIVRLSKPRPRNRADAIK